MDTQFWAGNFTLTLTTTVVKIGCNLKAKNTLYDFTLFTIIYPTL